MRAAAASPYDAPGRPTVHAVLERNRDTFSVLLAFSVAMFASALGAFCAFSSEAVGSLFADTRAGRDIVGAVAAVIVTNGFIAAYVVFAFREAPDEEVKGGTVPPPPPRSDGSEDAGHSDSAAGAHASAARRRRPAQ